MLLGPWDPCTGCRSSVLCVIFPGRAFGLGEQRATSPSLHEQKDKVYLCS